MKKPLSTGMAITFILWAAAVLGGTFALARYSNSPGGSGRPPVEWPRASQIEFNSALPTLVMFVHPKCPCSRASLGELDVLLARCSGQVSAGVVFLKPTDTATNWEKTDLWRTAFSIPGVKVYTDHGGVEARRFHAETSGQTLLYDRNGTLEFQGGITGSRSHSGDNPGRSALQELLRNGHPQQITTPVFGCSLFEAQCKEGDRLCKP